MQYLPRILKYLRPYTGLAFVAVMLIVLVSLADLLGPWPLKILVDNALGDQAPPHWLTAIVGSAASHSSLLLFAVLAGLGTTLLTSGLNVLNNYIQTKLEQRIVLDFRSDLFQHAQRLALAFHDQRRSGMLIYAVNGQGDAVAGMIMVIPNLAHSLFTLIGMFWILIVIDWELALLSAAIVPFLLWSVRYYATHIQDRLMRVKGMEGESLSIVHEAFSMLRVIVAFGREPFEFLRFRKQGLQAIGARIDVTVRQTLFLLAVNMTTAVGTAGVLGLGAYRVLQGRLTVGDLLVVMAYIAAVYKPLEAISYTLGSIQDKIVSQRIGFNILDTIPEVADRPDAIEATAIRGRVEFQNVSFHYRERVDTLRQVSFTVEPRQRVGIVGPTGAGKTTLVSLLPRFYDVGDGQILIDGRDIRDFTLKSLRQQISVVLQEPLLFSASVAENLRYGRLDASDDDVIEAAKVANAHEFIIRLPQQYETELGERGAKLSAGERQRLCIARSFLKDAPILVLDEPTSSIDLRTEAMIFDAMDRLMVGRTTFVIAHRISTVQNADLILVVDRGRVIEHGTHEELVARDGLYRQLLEMQTANAKRWLKPHDSRSLVFTERQS